MNITQPTLVLDKERALRNIARMAHRASRSGTRFRPHCKTHQSAEVASWFRVFGVDAISVPSVALAEYFGNHGWQDISITHPVNWRQLDRIQCLARKLTLGLVVESSETVCFLTERMESEIGVWLEIDVGSRRTGFGSTDLEAICETAQLIGTSPRLRFRGIMTHAGHSYRAVSKEALRLVAYDSLQAMGSVQERLEDEGHGAVQLSFGDTPCCSVLDDFHGVDEIRPGTFVFYDVQQRSLGACCEEDIAVAVACPVVAKNARRRELMVYGGASHLSKDFIASPQLGKIFGYATEFTEDGWGAIDADCYVSSLSQEVGTVKVSPELFRKIDRGDILAVLPAHACLCVGLLRRYVTLDEEIIDCASVGPEDLRRR